MNIHLQNSIPLGSSKKRKFGTVLLLEDADSKERFVLKSAKKAAITVQALQQLKNEAAFSFSHPGLPQVISFDETTDTVSVLLAYKKGTELVDFWNSVPKKKRLDFTKQLVIKTTELLNEIHSLHIYHCDIKPSNILIEEKENDFDVHLIDFGMAVDKNNPDFLNRKLIFPLGFAPPELILNKIELVNNTTDYFALGITIYRLWTGQLPLAHKNPSVFTNLQLAHPVPSHPSMPKQLNKWIATVCSKPNWRTAPNLMPEEEVIATLLHAFNNRYSTPEEFINGVNGIEKGGFFTRLFS